MIINFLSYFYKKYMGHSKNGFFRNKYDPHLIASKHPGSFCKIFQRLYLLLSPNCSNNLVQISKEKLIPLVIHNIILNKSIPVYGNGKNIRDGFM